MNKCECKNCCKHNRQYLLLFIRTCSYHQVVHVMSTFNLRFSNHSPLNNNHSELNNNIIFQNIDSFTKIFTNRYNHNKKNSKNNKQKERKSFMKNNKAKKTSSQKISTDHNQSKKKSKGNRKEEFEIKPLLQLEDIKYVDLNNCYVAGFDVDEKGEIIMGFEEYTKNECPKDTLDLSSPCVVWDDSGNIALSYFTVSDILPKLPPTLLNLLQYKGEIINSDSENQNMGFNLKCRTTFSALENHVTLYDDGMIEINIPEQLILLNKDAEQDLFEECTRSLFISKSLTPWGKFNPQIIEENIGYKFIPYYLLSSREVNYSKYLEHLAEEQIISFDYDEKVPLKVEFGLERIELDRLPTDGLIYYIPTRIHFNSKQSELGFAFYDAVKGIVLDLHIIRNFRQISAMYKTDRLEDYGYFKDANEFKYELLIGIKK